VPRSLKLFAVVILVALLPLRAVAGVTIGFCATGHQETAVGVQATGHAHEASGHARHGNGNDVPSQPIEASCSICAEHCSSAAFAVPTEPAVEPWPTMHDRTAFTGRTAPAFVPDRLDRPPLA